MPRFSCVLEHKYSGNQRARQSIHRGSCLVVYHNMVHVSLLSEKKMFHVEVKFQDFWF